jgi:phosphate-selective porin OprO/OprP
MAGPVGDPDGQVDAWYLQTTWTVTGEGRAYKAAEGVPDIVKPTGKWGAVELVAKYDWIAFDADDRSTESARGYLAGINWYVDKHIKLMLNYTHLDSNNLVDGDEDETSDVISTRIQFAF